MLPSPIQLKDMSYLGIKVWPRQQKEGEPAFEQPFDFDDVMIGEGAEVVALPEDEAKTIYAVKLHIMIENKEGKLAPYDIDIEAAGMFVISDKIKAEEREEMMTVNGCAVLYGCIRDQVLTLTSRCSNGPLMLPTVNFLDRKKKKPAEKKIQDA